MYLDYWQLDAKPFEPHCEAPFLFTAARRTRRRCTSCGTRSRIAAPRACSPGRRASARRCWSRRCASELDANVPAVVRVVFPQMTDRDLLVYLAEQLGAPPADPPRHTIEESLRRLEYMLGENVRRERHAVIVIDEAHLLEDSGLLEPLRLLLNLTVDGRPGVHAAAGRPAGAAADGRRGTAALDERLDIKVFLPALTADETAAYVAHRLDAAGATPGDLLRRRADDGPPAHRRRSAADQSAVRLGAAGGLRQRDARRSTPTDLHAVHDELVRVGAGRRRNCVWRVAHDRLPAARRHVGYTAGMSDRAATTPCSRRRSTSTAPLAAAFPRSIFGEGKTPATIVAIARQLLGTRPAGAGDARRRRAGGGGAARVAGGALQRDGSHAARRCARRSSRATAARPRDRDHRRDERPARGRGSARDARLDGRRACGWCTDVGVAGPHRLPARLAEFADADAIVVVAGMEGALPSVVGGYVPCPVFAVPTSVGYGASFGGAGAAADDAQQLRGQRGGGEYRRRIQSRLSCRPRRHARCVARARMRPMVIFIDDTPTPLAAAAAAAAGQPQGRLRPRARARRVARHGGRRGARRAWRRCGAAPGW